MMSIRDQRILAAEGCNVVMMIDDEEVEGVVERVKTVLVATPEPRFAAKLLIRTDGGPARWSKPIMLGDRTSPEEDQ